MSAETSFDQALGLAAEINSPIAGWDDFVGFLNKISRRLAGFIRDCPAPSAAAKTVFFGAGGHGQYLLKACRALGRSPDFFCDNDRAAAYLPWLQNVPPKQGTRLDGLEVLKPDQLSSIQGAEVVVATSIPQFRRQIEAQLRELGAPEMAAPGRYFYQAVMLKTYADFYTANLRRLLRVFESLTEARSRLVYLSVLKARLIPYELTESLYYEINEGGQYWARSEFGAPPPGIFIDAGAYTGDTVTRYVHRHLRSGFEKIHAFEPDPGLAGQLRREAARLTENYGLDPAQIVCMESGLGSGSRPSPAALIQQRTKEDPLSAPQAMNLVQVEPSLSLDDYLAGGPAGFIKADIEGFELDLIQGAAGTIEKYRPHLAICIYHLPDDIFTIPLTLKELVPEYHLAVRHHSGNLPETVLYCWV